LAFVRYIIGNLIAGLKGPLRFQGQVVRRGALRFFIFTFAEQLFNESCSVSVFISHEMSFQRALRFAEKREEIGAAALSWRGHYSKRTQ
jgi:hypothetical protein